MIESPQLIVMLTYNDLTVSNAAEIFCQCRESKAEYWGFKEAPLPLTEMKALYRDMKEAGKTTFLEVVEYTTRECMAGAEMAAECGCDVLMGTIYSNEINNFCRRHNIKYMPFVGNIVGRPSVLEGSLDCMVAEAKHYIESGVYGIDLLGYRYKGDAALLNKGFVAALNAPVCLAGSINSYARLAEVKEAAPWSFTIGSAFFDGCFGDKFCEQIDRVCDFMREGMVC